MVGHGVAGRLHERVLTGLGYAVSVVDPALGAQEAGGRAHRRVAEAAGGRPVDAWSVCTPTSTHVSVLAEVLAADPGARVVVEKPACRPRELPRFRALLADHPRARAVLMNQYRHAHAMAVLRSVLKGPAAAYPLQTLRVGFGKDRREDIAAGRFVDRDHGIFGYEWLHMLALVGGVLPEESFGRYLRTDPREHTLRVAADPELTSTAAHETAVVDGTAVELYSTIAGPDVPGLPAPGWLHRPRARGETRHRQVDAVAGPVRISLELAPATLTDGTPLPGNTHRMSVEGPGTRNEWLIHDSPMDNALRWSMSALFGEAEPPGIDLRPTARIGRLADAAHRAPSPALSAGPVAR
ncbi:Gfo/Idh/MocA family oxidoreductase [Nocardiopsis suaedae]|uniref:ABC transporter ATP-binding protein n=1 Tax=Nocardiopsis suaedae TaxID=3018444 RepID=A0ABT4TQA5_9ACTN|nr:ABC transporter ATP-binding protein [Nocardiopsis suaedae]MDA2806857.1 ABC transporter ATP-binding protein [Nocardiopsis suaedae]